jgi:hypothetical protein
MFHTYQGISIMIIYDGPSLLDGQPIVAIATIKSGNSKTGDMVQTWILCRDTDPRDANKNGSDYAICGTCPHRGIANTDPARKLAKKRTCYVNIGQGVLNVWRTYQRGRYADATGHDATAAVGAGLIVRLGSYGDPAAVPRYVWDSLLSLASGHTGYSHQENTPGAEYTPDLTMYSADSLADAQAAWQRGDRTFRIVANVKDIVRDFETLCPASKEAGFRTTCDKCKLCGGNSVKAKSIAIPAHGPGATHFAA